MGIIEKNRLHLDGFFRRIVYCFILDDFVFTLCGISNIHRHRESVDFAMKLIEIFFAGNTIKRFRCSQPIGKSQVAII